jgi:hypothetical protein
MWDELAAKKTTQYNTMILHNIALVVGNRTYSEWVVHRKTRRKVGGSAKYIPTGLSPKGLASKIYPLDTFGALNDQRSLAT